MPARNTQECIPPSWDSDLSRSGWVSVWVLAFAVGVGVLVGVGVGFRFTGHDRPVSQHRP